MKNDRLKNIIEWSVAASMLFSLLMVILGLLIQSISSDNHLFFLSIYNSPYLSALTVLVCCLLVLWIAIGKGAESKLWKWLPPFLFFQGWGKFGRVFVVLALVAAMLTGVISDIIGSYTANDTEQGHSTLDMCISFSFQVNVDANDRLEPASADRIEMHRAAMSKATGPGGRRSASWSIRRRAAIA